WLVKVMVEHDRSNWFYYFRDGWQHQLHAQTVYTVDEPSFYIAFNDLKYYERVGQRGNFASRLRMGLSSNQESPFAPFVLDSYLNIRGVGNRVDRGTGSVVLNLEYRHTFLESKKIALQAVAFSDLGTWRNPGGSLNDFAEVENIQSFAGFGVRAIHKEIFNAILRLDYGVDLQDLSRSGFVVGIGQYF
ncbi:MAG: outer membrane protein insertion porin family, partial [Flavobacteriaceae bacterium]